MTKNKPLIQIKDLEVTIEGKEILKGVNLEVNEGEVAVLMGPNGSGKSTLSFALMGHPKYIVTKGSIIYKGENITKVSPTERSKKGMFLSFQYPSEIAGVTIANFLRTALNARRKEKLNPLEFRKMLKEKMKELHFDEQFANRYLNEGFSGGEKKKAEMLQLAVLQPMLAILDETDSGTDVDALKIIGNTIKAIQKETKMTVLIITHYNRILQYLDVDKVYVMEEGKITRSGDVALAHEIEKTGYKKS
ncbi:MAG TPA: Fe-S cluster assembly ATPase SufC [Candidatus Nanoarchaeia archaeon]|nr:Fe-S cluster assembly ATPase SufC [Candidatus Nanoarchaeia archaeon]